MKLRTFSLFTLMFFGLVSLTMAQIPIDATLPNVDVTNGAVHNPGTMLSRGWSDDFNRPNSTNMGPNWIEVAGDMQIDNNMGFCTSMGYMLHATAFAPYEGSTQSVDFFHPGAILVYQALIAGAGTDFIFVKVQDNNSDGFYDRVFFYKNHNGGSWGASPYYFDLAVPTTSGRMTLSFDASGDVATLEIDRDFDGINDESFSAANILAAGLNLGQGFGIATWNNQNHYDNWELNNGSGGGALTVSPNVITASIGGTATFTLDAGAMYAGGDYLIIGSVTGTSPGVPLKGGNNLPTNWDIFTNITIDFANTTIFPNTMGTLDMNGQATAGMDTLGPLPPSAVGLVMDFAFPVPAKPAWFASNAASITIN